MEPARHRALMANPFTHNMRASLFFKSKKAIICTPKMIAEDAMAVRRATRLIPSEPCADPAPVDVVAAGLTEAEEGSVPKTEDMLSNVER